MPAGHAATDTGSLGWLDAAQYATPGRLILHWKFGSPLQSGQLVDATETLLSREISGRALPSPPPFLVSQTESIMAYPR